MSNNTLSNKDIAALKARAHHLNPVVLIGQHGLTDSIVKETERNLIAHELIKVQIAGADRTERLAAAQALCAATNALLVQQIGKQTVLFRSNPEA